MSDQSEEYHIINAVVTAFNTDRPASLPNTIAVAPEIQKAEAGVLGVVVKMENGEWIHPKLYQGELVLELRANAGDVTSEAAFAGWCAAMESILLQRAEAIRTALRQKGLVLCHLMILRPEEGPDGEQGFVGVRRWTLRVRKAA